MKQTVQIKNPNGENLDTLVEGNDKSDTTVIMVHGFGTDKHETGGLFDDITESLSDTFRIARFDFSGYGKSQGKQEDVNYRKHAQDLAAILDFVRDKYPGKIYILAQSMGCYVTALLSPSDIEKTIMQAPPNADVSIMKQGFIDYFSKRNVKFNTKGITYIKRSSGKTQMLGPTFWEELEKFDSNKLFSALDQKTNLLIIHPKEDEIIGDEGLELYKNLPNTQYLEIPGNHSFANPEDRKNLISKITLFYK